MINEDELFEHIEDLQWELDFCRKELDYYCSFLSWKKLWDEFEYFQRNAHLEYPDENADDPFPRYVL